MYCGGCVMEMTDGVGGADDDSSSRTTLGRRAVCPSELGPATALYWKGAACCPAVGMGMEVESDETGSVDADRSACLGDIPIPARGLGGLSAIEAGAKTRGQDGQRDERRERRMTTVCLPPSLRLRRRVLCRLSTRQLMLSRRVVRKPFGRRCGVCSTR